MLDLAMFFLMEPTFNFPVLHSDHVGYEQLALVEFFETEGKLFRKLVLVESFVITKVSRFCFRPLLVTFFILFIKLTSFNGLLF